MEGSGEKEVFSVINKNFLLSLPPPTTLDAVSLQPWPGRAASLLSFAESRVWDPNIFWWKSPRPAQPSPATLLSPRLKINLVGGLRGIFSSVTFNKKIWLVYVKIVWALDTRWCTKERTEWVSLVKYPLMLDGMGAGIFSMVYIIYIPPLFKWENVISKEKF